MIPKKIHYCWLSGDEYPQLIKHCLETWKRILPDYELILWDTHKFDINSIPWVKEAFEAKNMHLLPTISDCILSILKEGFILIQMSKC